MKHLKLVFEDILQSKILFYAQLFEAACFNICSHLQIDDLPAIDGQHFYELSGKEFIKKEIKK